MKSSEFTSQEPILHLFLRQLIRLRVLGYPDSVVKHLQQQQDCVISRACSTPPVSGILPLLPVVPRGIVSLSVQMVMVYAGHTMGEAAVQADSIQSSIQTSLLPYYIFDVKAVDKRLSTSGSPARCTTSRVRGLVVEEGIALATHTDTLSKHDIYTVGSLQSGSVLRLTLESGKPLLECCYNVHRLCRPGAASCSVV